MRDGATRLYKSAQTSNPARQETYDFTDPYAYNRTAVMSTGGNSDIQAMEDLQGKKTANTISSTYAELAEQYGAEVTYYDYMEAHPDADLKIAVLTEEANQIAIPMRKGEETATLREAINNALAELSDEGVLSELSVKYFGSDISQAS